MTFSFDHWRKWLESKQAQFVAEGFEVKFSQNDRSKPGTGIGLKGKKAIGDFSNWNTGETDYTVCCIVRRPLIPWKKTLKQTSHKWGVLASDETFEALFEEFVAHVREVEGS